MRVRRTGMTRPGGLTEEDLRIRLVPRTERPGVVHVRWGELFDIVLVSATGPDRELTHEEVRRLGVIDDLIKAAMRRTAQHELGQLDIREHRAGSTRFTLIAIDDSPYVSCVLLVLDRIVAPAPVGGVFITVPTFDAVLFHRLDAGADAEVLDGMSEIATHLAEVGSECDRRVHWWGGGVCQAIGRAPGGRIVAPAALVAALHTLGG